VVPVPFRRQPSVLDGGVDRNLFPTGDLGMFTSSKRVALLAVATALCVPLSARAQIQMAPGLAGANPYNAGVAGNPYAGGGGGNNAFFNRSGGVGIGGGGSNPYTTSGTMSSVQIPFSGAGSFYGSNPYVQPWTYYGEAGGFLIGASSVIDSSGKLMLSTQQARLMNEQVKREKLNTRRALIEEWLWERNNLPTLQDEIERIQRLSLRRMQNDPPITEITVGQALNELLTDIQKKASIQGPEITLNEEMLRKINVSPVGKGVNLGPLKNEGALSWPLALKNPNFRRDREALNDLAKVAYNQGSKGQVDAAVINQMNDSVDRLLGDLTNNIKEMGPSKYIEAKRFLNDLKDATRGLERNDVANFFNNKYAAKGNTVAELAKNMTRDGLRFAPAMPGDESAYVALHRLLAAYDVAINGAVADTRPNQP
jgi:hypothetical protein